MFVKKITAFNIQEGWRKVRETLGEDAIILSVKEIDGIFEIIATSPNEKVKEIKEKAINLINLKSFVKKLEKSLLDEDVKKLIEEDILLTYTPVVESLPEDFSEKIEVNPLRKKYLLLLGSIASGKSVTLAKIAAILKFDLKKSVCIASFDFYKIGGSETLKSFSEIMQVPFLKIKNEKDLIQNKDYFEEFDHVLFDTPGNLYEIEEIEKLIYLISRGSNTENILVLPLTKKEILLEKDFHYFSKFNIDHLILTKYDLLENKLPLLYIFSNINTPVSFITNGVNVPQDIFHAKDLLEKKVL